ncbi:hypothetical protein AVEN_70579-1 [Araneus ventricosus]|uniref:Uncharacterized protein n=1 Tax=Araneus ventricosus TaxID=182803 RepID=A0A4Y2CIP3_ARAVE|nr:hypothetical protein AVEN_70579-1 [Araneus ventricosus]
MFILSFFSKHRKFRFTRDVYDVSRCIVGIDVYKRREEHCSRSSEITVTYLSPRFFHRDSSSRHTLRSEHRCADTMNPDVTANENGESNSFRELRKRSVLSIVESLSHRNVHYFVWPRASF